MNAQFSLSSAKLKVNINEIKWMMFVRPGGLIKLQSCHKHYLHEGCNDKVIKSYNVKLYQVVLK